MASSFPPSNYFIISPRLVIRTAVPADAEGVHRFLTTAENMPPGDSVDSKLTPEIMGQRIEKWKISQETGKNAFLIITLRETGEVIGQGGFNTFEAADGSIGRYLTDIGVMIDHRHWRKGLATEAMCSCVEYAFSEAGCEVVRVETGAENEPFRAFMRGVGFNDIEIFDPVSYQEGKSGWVYRFGSEAWETVKGDLKTKGKWPL